MKQNIIKLLLVLFLGSCSVPKKDMEVEVFVKDLKKGTLYLERVQDSILVAVDSMQITQEKSIVLEADLNHPELFYVLLDRNKADDFDNRIPFFGEAGNISIQTTLDGYVTKAEVVGSPTQDIFNSYNKVITQFNNEELDLLAAYLKAQISQNNDSLALLENQSANLAKRKILFTANFAVNNNTSVIAPYLALHNLTSGSKTLLDTIAASMSDYVRNSRYGKQLRDYLADAEK
ncbi:DUF4369 domain-containing protein [Flavobacteriaceae bacterium]|nr:DUF4369 domain-containing protein [Flavobacteriaceae bacterium]